MVKYLFLFLSLLQIGFSQAQVTDTAWKKEFRESAPRINNLVHTKLDLRFDYDKSYLYGKEWLTLQPHFYPIDSLLLDAKGMDIKEVSLVAGNTKKPLKYDYDGLQLNIKLDKTYKAGENYTLYFDYVSKPNELKVKGSAAITDAKGLYFINPKGEEKGKPTQIWTQGETEANSVWMITIDKPNQKTTQEIAMTVPAKYVTLSNGLKVSEKVNSDGTRTDVWKQDLPHAPYLFFLGVGEYAIVKDIPYKGKEVSYYVEKEQAPYAKGVFGNTPEMMKFFSDKMGIDYPWAKYSQIVGRDYVSGAMENTTATLHMEAAYQNNRQLADENKWESTIAHELFHHWFGDLVTTESWSNLALNESFANYSEYLWNEYKYGKDKADEANLTDMQGYLQSGSNHKQLIRYYYADKEDMFDAVSYNKGGRILHMLRNVVGDDAFFKSLNLYLNNRKFKTGEAADLRLAFEEVTGLDLNWFWNQWFYGSGQPKLDISYKNTRPGFTTVVVKQLQNGVFKLPVNIDVYDLKGKAQRHKVWLEQAVDSFTFRTESPDALINVDADKILLAEKEDHRSAAQQIALYKYGKLYLDRREALEYLTENNMKELVLGLNDPYAPLKAFTIGKLMETKSPPTAETLQTIEKIAREEKNNLTRAAAINLVGMFGDKKYLPVFDQGINDSSYAVAAASLKGITLIDIGRATSLARSMKTSSGGDLNTVIAPLLMQEGNPDDFEFITSSYRHSNNGDDIIGLAQPYGEYASKMTDIKQVFTAIDLLVRFKKMIPAAYQSMTDKIFDGALGAILKAKGKPAEDYLAEKTKQ